jgi:hypothetical protein
VALESIQVHLPKRAIAFEPARDLLQSERSELIEPLPTCALLGHELREAKDAQVLRYGGPTLLEVGRQCVHRRGTRAKAIEDRPARRVRDGVEDVGVRSGSGHGEDLNE